MDQDDFGLSHAEELLLHRSADRSAPQRRLVFSLISAAVLAVLVVIAGWLSGAPLFLMAVFVLYIILTSYERYLYARTLRLYRGLVLKLWGLTQRR